MDLEAQARRYSSFQMSLGSFENQTINISKVFECSFCHRQNEHRYKVRN